MRRLLVVLAVAVALVPWTSVVAQFPPDLGPAGKVADQAAGKAVPPAMRLLYNATGQNVTREDVRLFVDLNFTKGDVNLFGLLIGSGKAEVQAHLNVRAEMRVISSDRIRAAIDGENAYNMSAENATFLSEAYLPADAFRASLTAEAIALFQRAQEQALAKYLAASVPEMDVLSLEIAWSNVTPQKAFTDTDFREPPIVVELDLIVQYIRVESLPGLLKAYTGSKDKGEGKSEYVKELKQENGAEPAERDFMGAAAYTQLLNLSMQPGWSLGVGMSVPTGYSFTYFNAPVVQRDERSVSKEINALESDEDVQEILLASITHRRAVAFALFVAMIVVGLVVAFPVRFAYARWRLPKLAAETTKS